MNDITTRHRMETELRYRELVRIERRDRLMALLQARLDRTEAALFADHPAWPIIAKAIGLTHAETCQRTSHRSRNTIRRNLWQMVRYGISLAQLPAAGNA